ncbi:MAG: SCO family protein [Planctomycetes bacterium]|nr:SCO family protein [Planctomycetota bacterium]
MSAEPSTRPALPRGKLLLAALVLLIAALVAFPFLARESSAGGGGASPVALAERSPEELGELADFALTERSGRSVAKSDLAGTVWVAGFVFTRCTGPCPKVTGHMRKLQDGLVGTRAKLVTFSVDPDYDTPEVLRGYADGVGADPERWWMLTGPKEAIDGLIPSFVPKTQRAAPGAAPIGEHVAHQTRLWVIDGKGRIRGLYSGESDEHLELLLARVKYLESER